MRLTRDTAQAHQPPVAIVTDERNTMDLSLGNIALSRRQPQLGFVPAHLAGLAAHYRADRVHGQVLDTEDFSTDVATEWSLTKATVIGGQLSVTDSGICHKTMIPGDFVMEIDETFNGDVGGVSWHLPLTTGTYPRCYNTGAAIVFQEADASTNSATVPWTSGETKRWKIVQVGSHVRVFLDNVLHIDVPDSDPTDLSPLNYTGGPRKSTGDANRWDNYTLRTVNPAVDMVYATDTFTRADGPLAGTSTEPPETAGNATVTASTTHTWANVAGKINLDIDTNSVTPTAAGLAWGVFDVGEPDVDIRMTFTADTLETSTRAGIIYRYVDATNHCRAVYVHSTGDIYLQAILAGVPTQIITPWTPVAGATYEMRVVTRGDQHYVFIDGVDYGTLTSANNNTATSVGMELQRTVAGTISAQDLAVCAPPHAATIPDLSGNGRHLVQIDADAAPLLLPDQTETGRPALAFAAGQSLATRTAFDLTQPCTIAAVAGRPAAGGAAQSIVDGNTGTASERVAIYSTSDIWRMYSGTTASVGTSATDGPNRLVTLFDEAASEALVNGISFTGRNVGTGNIKALTIGKNNTGSGGWESYISEVIAWDADHSAEFTEIDGYLERTWG